MPLFFFPSVCGGDPGFCTKESCVYSVPSLGDFVAGEIDEVLSFR